MAAVNTGKYRAEKPARKKFEPGAGKADIPRLVFCKSNRIFRFSFCQQYLLLF